MQNHLDAICPVFFVSEDRPIEQIGSGVLVDFRESTFLLTAGHVIDEMKHGGLMVPIEGDIIADIDGSYSYYEPKSSRDEDLMDFGYFKLESEFAIKIKSQFYSIPEHELHITDGYGDMDLFSFSGFPYRKSKRRSDTVRTEMFSYGAYHASSTEYQNLGCNPKHNIVTKFNRKKSINPYTDKFQIPPLPHGISGGGVFIWPKDIDEIPPKNRKLTAISHTYKKNDGYFIGTNIQVFLKSILFNNPELQKT
jgi:hypothetical protein